MSKVVLGAGREQGDGLPGGGFAVLAPMLLGFTAPLIVLILLDPSVLSHARTAITSVLAILFVIVTVIFIYSVFAQKLLVSVALEPEAGVASFHYASTFASDTEEVPLASIRAIRTSQRYDHDGYASPSVELVMVNGDCIVLPEGVTAADAAQADALLRRMR